MLIEKTKPYFFQFQPKENGEWLTVSQLPNNMLENDAYADFYSEVSKYVGSFELIKVRMEHVEELTKYKITRHTSRYTLYAWDESIKQWIDLGGKVFANDKQAIDYYSGFGNRLLRSKTIHEFFA